MTFKSIMLCLLLAIPFAFSAKPLPCDKPVLWIPSKFDAKTFDVSDWKKYTHGNKKFINKGGQVYKGGKGLWYQLNIDNDIINFELNFDNKLYPGGDIYYGIYERSSFSKVRDSMCKDITPLPTNTILDETGPMDTTTLSYFMMEMHSTRGSTSFNSKSISSLLKGCLSEPVPFLLVSFLDYTNPYSRVLGRYFATESPEITSDNLCKDPHNFFKWLVFGLSCPC